MTLLRYIIQLRSNGETTAPLIRSRFDTSERLAEQGPLFARTKQTGGQLKTRTTTLKEDLEPLSRPVDKWLSEHFQRSHTGPLCQLRMLHAPLVLPTQPASREYHCKYK